MPAYAARKESGICDYMLRVHQSFDGNAVRDGTSVFLKSFFCCHTAFYVRKKLYLCKIFLRHRYAE